MPQWQDYRNNIISYYCLCYCFISLPQGISDLLIFQINKLNCVIKASYGHSKQEHELHMLFPLYMPKLSRFLHKRHKALLLHWQETREEDMLFKYCFWQFAQFASPPLFCFTVKTLSIFYSICPFGVWINLISLYVEILASIRVTATNRNIWEILHLDSTSTTPSTPHLPTFLSVFLSVFCLFFLFLKVYVSLSVFNTNARINWFSFL